MCVFFAKKPQKLPKSAQCEPPKNYKAALITTYLKSISDEWQILYASIQKCAHIIAEIFKQNDKKKEMISQKKMMSQLEFFLHNFAKSLSKKICGF